MNKLFMILKPEMDMWVNKLEDMLSDEGFDILSRHPIPNWERLAKKIYAPQIDSSYEFASDFFVYLLITKYLFDNRALAFVLEDKRNPVLIDGLKSLFFIKLKFREKMYQELGNNTIYYSLDSGQLMFKEDYTVGPDGRIRVNTRNKVDSNGTWDTFSFKYVHCPDPSYPVLKREFEILERDGVLSYNLPKTEWDVMKSLGILVPLTEHKTKDDKPN